MQESLHERHDEPRLKVSRHRCTHLTQPIQRMYKNVSYHVSYQMSYVTHSEANIPVIHIQ